MRNFLINKFLLLSLPITLTVIGGVLHAESDLTFLDENLEIHSINSKIESLGLENKINKSFFLPELFLTGGLGSEKLQENSYESEKGPFIFLESKLNLYRGGRDSGQIKRNDLELSSAKIELEIKKRDLQISSFKLLATINLISKEINLIKSEIESNKAQQDMAKKKLNAGLTSSIDLIDFDIKNDNLSNELEILILKSETLKKELSILVGGNLSTNELESILATNTIKADDIAVVNYENSPKLILSRKKIDLSAINLDNVRAENLPSVDLEAKWGHITPQESFLSSQKEHQIALNITFPLFTGFSTNYKYKQSVLESAQKKRELNQAELEEKTMQDLELKKIELSKKILLSLNHSLSQSIKYKKLTIDEYKRGIKNSPDIISASDKKLEIERKILGAKNDLAISHFTLNETFKPYVGE